MRIERPRTIAEVAAMATRGQDRWSPYRAKCLLYTLDDQLGGMLLTNRNNGRGKPVTVLLSTLKKVAPQLFDDSRSIGAEIDEHDERIRTLESENKRLIRRVGQLSTMVEELQKRWAA